MMRRAEERGPSQAAWTETETEAAGRRRREVAVRARPRKPERSAQQVGLQGAAWWVKEVEGQAVAAAVAAMMDGSVCTKRNSSQLQRWIWIGLDGFLECLVPCSMKREQREVCSVVQRAMVMWIGPIHSRDFSRDPIAAAAAVIIILPR